MTSQYSKQRPRKEKPFICAGANIIIRINDNRFEKHPPVV